MNAPKPYNQFFIKSIAEILSDITGKNDLETLKCWGRTFEDIFIKELTTGDWLSSNARKMLCLLRKRGMKVAILSNHSRKVIEAILRHYRLQVDLILCPDYTKELSKDFFKELLDSCVEYTGLVPSEMIYFCDTAKEIKIAKAFGLNVVGVTSEFSADSGLHEVQNITIVRDIGEILYRLRKDPTLQNLLGDRKAVY
jgi:phosphoglycolate phosphatase-like HAD superfamily hydrolase